MAMSDLIYMDNAATTALDPLVLEAMMPYLTDNYANASGVYNPASKARSAVNRARMSIAGIIGAEPDEIYFTSGGTESDNIALRGLARVYTTKENSFRVVSDELEHPAVRETLKALKKENLIELKYVPNDIEGFIDPNRIEDMIRSHKNDLKGSGQEPDNGGCAAAGSESRVRGLVSVMHANNEIGTINDIAQISQTAHKYGYLMHTDAVQTLGHIPVDTGDLGVDLLSASAHKLGGPKGIGLLYVRRGTKIDPIIFGGGQEKGMRSGTYNTAAIVGFGKAAELAAARLEEDTHYLIKLRERLVSGIMGSIPGTVITGPASGTDGRRLPGHASFAFKGIQGSSLIIGLDIKEICASTGSACAASSQEASQVLRSVKIPADYINGSLRLTLSRNNTVEEVDSVITAVRTEVFKLRELFG